MPRTSEASIWLGPGAGSALLMSAEALVERDADERSCDCVVVVDDWPLMVEPEVEGLDWLVVERSCVVRSCVVDEPVALGEEPRCDWVALGADGEVELEPDEPLVCASAGAASSVVAKR